MSPRHPLPLFACLAFGCAVSAPAAAGFVLLDETFGGSTAPANWLFNGRNGTDHLIPT